MADPVFKLLMKDTVTIQRNTPSITTSGATTDSWTNVSGLVDLPCAIQANPSPRYNREGRMPEYTYAESMYTINLADQYSSILPRDQAVASDGNTYDIQNASSEPYGAFTVLLVRLIQR